MFIYPWGYIDFSIIPMAALCTEVRYWKNLITVDGSLCSDEAHQESMRRRLLYIHEEVKIAVIVRSLQVKDIAKTKLHTKL